MLTALAAAPLVVAVVVIVALVWAGAGGGVAPSIDRLIQARAGRLAGVPGASGRDTRFGIAEAYKNDASKGTAIGWERLTFPWNQIQPGGPDDFRADLVFPPDKLQAELGSGVEIAGLLQFTPGWAQANPGDGQRSVPRNLGAAWNDPGNAWGQFTRKMAEHYRGRVDTWIIWNEPEIRPGDAGGGSSWTWAGGPAEYAQLLRVAYLNIKAANPDARVIFAGTAYWLDENSGRAQFLERVLDVLAADHDAPSHNWYFDAVAFNMYRAPDDIYRLAFLARAILQSHGLTKELWLTEMNAMPYDPTVPCADRFRGNPANVDLETQARFATQSVALALAAGWSRVEFYQMTDSGTCQESSIWGLARDDGSLRPVYNSYKTVLDQLRGVSGVTFAPLTREVQRWGTPWPDNPQSYYPNWQIYQVVADRDDQRVIVLWNADGAPVRARVPKVGTSAVRLDKFGNQQSLSDTSGWYVVDLGPASAHGPQDPDGYFYIGSDPVIIVQGGVPAGTAVTAPALGDPGSAQTGFKAYVSPENGQKLAAGGTAQFTLRVVGEEGFSDPVSVRFKEYSTQRDPAPVAALPSTLSATLPSTITPGSSASAQVQTTADVAPGIHYITLELDADGLSQTVDLVVQVD